jgi:Ca2+-transporting ATPase
MLAGGIWSTVANLGMFLWSLQEGHPLAEAMTLNFATLAAIQFFKAYNFRSDRASAFHRPFANRWLNWAVLWESVLLVAVIEVPFLQTLFGTVALSGEEWAIALGVAASVFPVLEAAKWMIRRSA